MVCNIGLNPSRVCFFQYHELLLIFRGFGREEPMQISPYFFGQRSGRDSAGGCRSISAPIENPCANARGIFMCCPAVRAKGSEWVPEGLAKGSVHNDGRGLAFSTLKSANINFQFIRITFGLLLMPFVSVADACWFAFPKVYFGQVGKSELGVFRVCSGQALPKQDAITRIFCLTRKHFRAALAAPK